MSYSVFESIEASESEQRLAANASQKVLDQAIEDVRKRHGSYLNGAADQDDFYWRLSVVKDDMRKVVEAAGVFPRKGIMRRVVNACRADSRPHWKRHAAEGTAVADAAPATDLTAPVGVLGDSPLGAVASRRHAGAENGTSDDFHDYGHRPDPEETERNNRGYSPVGKGMVQDWETGEIYPDPGKRVSFRDFLHAAAEGRLSDTAAPTPLIPEDNFEGYLNGVTGPETDAAASVPFGPDTTGERWENTGRSASFDRLLRQAEDYSSQGRAEPDGSVYDFTGSPETQYHHKQGPWPREGDIDTDAIYTLMDQGLSFDQARERAMTAARTERSAAERYARWCVANRYHAGHSATAQHYATLVPETEAGLLRAAVRHASLMARTASGKDHLTTSKDAITKMLNELAEDFQKSILPLQDALQSVEFAAQSMQAESPMNVMPPGSVNVMPEGMQDPAMGGGGAPPMQGQGMPAQPGPSGVSPMADPNATGGAPAGPGGGGDPLAGLPPEVLQMLMGGGGDPAAGGGGAPPAQRPVARRRQAGDAPPWADKDDDKSKKDKDDDEDESDSDDGFGGKKAPPFGKKSRRRLAGDSVEVSKIPPCDVCASQGQQTPAEYDASLPAAGGSWGYVCQRHFGEMGAGLGTGRGQRLVQRGGGGGESPAPSERESSRVIAYLRWAAEYRLPVNTRTARMYVEAGFPEEEPSEAPPAEERSEPSQEQGPPPEQQGPPEEADDAFWEWLEAEGIPYEELPPEQQEQVRQEYTETVKPQQESGGLDPNVLLARIEATSRGRRPFGRAAHGRR